MNDVSLGDGLRRLTRTVDELEPVLQSLVVNDTTILDALSQLLSALHTMQVRSEQSQARVADEVRALHQTVSLLKEQGGRSEPAPGAPEPDPESALLAHLYSFVAHPVAIDVGANVGRLAKRLTQAGWEVYAFEPYPSAFEALQARLGGQPRFHAEALAIGAADGQGDLHVATDLSKQDKWDASLFHSLVPHPMLEDCQFTGTVPVAVRSLQSLRQGGQLPAEWGLLKIDTEGNDLEVIRGMGSPLPAVMMAEYWNADHPFGRAGHGRLEPLVETARSLGYRWHLVIYHVDPTATVSFHCNRVDSVSGSWGNVLFFLQHDVFMRAMLWCEQSMAARVLVEVEGLTKVYGDVRAVDQVSFGLEAGELVGLLGPNGAGKTSIIHMMLGLVLPTSGSIRIFGRCLRKDREAILQQSNFAAPYVMFPGRLTVRENLTVLAGMYDVRRPQVRIVELLRQFDIEGLSDRPMCGLSSGEATRVGLCKAFLNDPKFLLLDEPTAYLDPQAAERVRHELRDLQARLGTTILYTSHNMAEVEALCTRVYFLSRGRVLACGTPLEVTSRVLGEARETPALHEVFLAVAERRS